MSAIGLAMAAFGAALVLTAMVRVYAVRRELLDTPNARSSHTVPTPRGGGVSIVLVYLVATAFAALAGWIDAAAALGLGGGALGVTAVGFWDDHGHVSRRLRFAVHLGAAVWALAWLGGLPPLPLGSGSVDLGLAGDALAAVAIVWLLNLYNFMDGIDGIAATEAITVAAGGALILLLGGTPGAAGWLFWLAASAAGFLVWNWPPARIFMGDAGSGFLGFAFGALAVATSHGGAINLWSWAILLAAFIGDATWTLLRRLARRDTWYEAHRSHAYQIAARRWGSHLKVTLLVGAFNLLWLLPLALLAANRPGWGWALALLAYLPVVAAGVGLGAGLPDDQVSRPVAGSGGGQRSARRS
ncbi:MAG: glycosyltransferase family 4 protein [Gammaproteobacteria bacterium]|nr:glycosyltransferase family 4 protein [Gammaproteobacteria bacterium]